MRKFAILLMSVTMLFSISACTLFPQYHSKETIQEVTEELFGETVTLLSVAKDKENKRVVYTYEDANGREFTVSSYAEHSNFDGAELPGYYNKIRESYQKDIFMDYRKEFDRIVEENTKNSEIVLDYISGDKTGEFTDWKVATMPALIAFTSYGTEEQRDEDLRAMARIGAKMDELLSYEYDWEKARFREDDLICDWYPGLCGILFKFEGENDGLRKQVMFDFSTSEEGRWTEESLYLYLKEQLLSSD